MTYYAIHKPTGHRYDIPETAHGTMFRLIEHWAEMGRDEAMRNFKVCGKIETRHVIFWQADEVLDLRPKFRSFQIGRVQ